ncbi:indolepyruvate oxidoreductase subunit beta [Slackia heliotrinireducens]|uniref:indolepyruvate oxidoreductase subunit beta n=1 Tax=Slackia heliotrinireducens TaxID=84110 RepID=UPI0033153375
MKNVVLTGIGGQGTVLAAKILAQAAQNRGWNVRTAETIGMAQRGGSVVSHVRMGDCGEVVNAPLVPTGQADMLIAFEPGEAARTLPLLRRDGVLITASRAIQPVTASLSNTVYASEPVIQALQQREGRTVVVDEVPLLAEIGNPKTLNIVLLTVAATTGALDLPIDELKTAVAACVKRAFVDMNLAAIDHVTGLYQN